MDHGPSVLFVCVKNAGNHKWPQDSCARSPPPRDVYSAGTNPGPSINNLSAQALAEVGVDITKEKPKLLDPQLVRDVDIVITLGREAYIEPVRDTQFETWDTDEPSHRGIDGIARMRLVRDDVTTRVNTLATRLLS